MSRRTDQQQVQSCDAGHHIPRFGCPGCIEIAKRRRREIAGAAPCSLHKRRPVFGCEACRKAAAVQERR